MLIIAPDEIYAICQMGTRFGPHVSHLYLFQTRYALSFKDTWCCTDGIGMSSIQI